MRVAEMKRARHLVITTIAGLALVLFAGSALTADGWRFTSSAMACGASTAQRGWSVTIVIKPEAPETITLEFDGKDLYPRLRHPAFAELRLLGAGKQFAPLFATRGPGGLIMEFRRSEELKLVLGLGGWFDVVSGDEPPQQVLLPGDVAGAIARLEQCLAKRS